MWAGRDPEFQGDTSDTGETDPLPVYKLADIAQNNGKNETRVYITYDGVLSVPFCFCLRKKTKDRLLSESMLRFSNCALSARPVTLPIVTDFLARHVGEAENILLTAGNSVEFFWNLYRQHYASNLPINVMENLIIGMLDDDEQQILDKKFEANHNSPYKMTVNTFKREIKEPYSKLQK